MQREPIQLNVPEPIRRYIELQERMIEARLNDDDKTFYRLVPVYYELRQSLYDVQEPQK